MNKTYEFYPMITGTIKTILTVTPEQNLSDIVDILTTYPDYNNNNNPFAKMVIDELDRQYARWNKGGQDAK